jgi:hypothetical protein
MGLASEMLPEGAFTPWSLPSKPPGRTADGRMPPAEVQQVRASPWADHLAIAGIRLGQPRGTQSHQQDFSYAPCNATTLHKCSTA